MANLESIFEKWLETGELTLRDRQLLEQDAVYAEMLENSETWQSLSAKYQETPVPQWNREATWFEKTSDGAKSNRFAAWFAPAALACSVLMCSLVIMRAEVSVSDSGFAINFAEQQKQDPTVTYEQLQTLLAEQQTNTAQATYALVKEAIEQGRVERKEDIGALVADLNRVRQQDQALIRLQLNELAQQVEQQPQSSIAKNHSWEN